MLGRPKEGIKGLEEGTPMRYWLSEFDVSSPDLVLYQKGGTRPFDARKLHPDKILTLWPGTLATGKKMTSYCCEEVCAVSDTKQ